MEIKTAEFKISSPRADMCPATNLPEYAFIGRSNVGKSSLINMLTRNKNLAKTSVKPGKTQLINHFLINNEWYLVDLPGYGYARISKNARSQWQHMISDYILKRENLANLFVLVDSRIPPQQIDIDFINFVGRNGIPLTLIFTKMHTENSSLNSLGGCKVLYTFRRQQFFQVNHYLSGNYLWRPDPSNTLQIRLKPLRP